MMRIIQYFLPILLFLFSLNCNNKKSEEKNEDLVFHLLLDAYMNGSNVPCVSTQTVPLEPIGTWTVGGNPFFYSETLPISLHRSLPMVQLFFEQNNTFGGALFPVFYENRSISSSGFLNRDVFSGLGQGSSTSMFPYGKDTAYATDPAVSILNTDSISSPLGVEFNLEIPVSLSATFISSCKTLDSDEMEFQTNHADSADSGLYHFWQTEKNLDVNLIFVNNGPDLAYPDQTLTALSVALNRWKENYSQGPVRININFSSTTLDSVEYSSIYDLSTSFIFPGTLGGLFTTTSYVGKPNALNVFIVKEELQYGGVLGVSGGIPGPAALLGTRQSGVAVFIETHRLTSNTGQPLTHDELLLLGETMSHEAGHFLGLWHVVEAFGDTGEVGSRDPLRDTPACGIWNDLNQDGFLSVLECSGFGPYDSGGRNMMFWSGMVGFAQGQITAEQGWILRLNPLVY